LLVFGRSFFGRAVEVSIERCARVQQAHAAVGCIDEAGMIESALLVLTRQVQGFLARDPVLEAGAQDKIHLTNIIDPDNASVTIPDESLGLCLVNIEEERVTKAQRASTLSADGLITYLNPELKLNLFVLIAANCSQYRTGLTLLSSAIRFFQSKNVFDHDNTPELDAGIQKLIVEMCTLTFEQQNHLWASLGAKYLPSVLYKVRMLVVQEGLVTEQQHPIVAVNSIGRDASER
jgi:hypothetical protein